MVQGIHESAGEVAGLLAVTALVALLAWLGRRQELRRAVARRARVVPPPLDAAVLSAPVDPWPDCRPGRAVAAGSRRHLGWCAVMAGEFAAGSALYGPRELRDPHTTATLAGFRRRLHDGTDAAVLAAAERVEHLPAAHPLCAELRQIVDAELAARHLSLAPLAGGAK